MKKIHGFLIGALSFCLVGVPTTIFAQQHLWQVDDQEFVAAVGWMYENEMTIYNNPTQFAPQNNLTREQAAKFFLEFAYSHDMEQVAGATPEHCAFTDLDGHDGSLRGSIIDACKQGLMLGHNGTFRPGDVLTKAEAVAILIRIDQGKLDETAHPRWRHYHAVAYANNLTKEADLWKLDLPVSRYEAALLLYRAAGHTFVDDTDNEVSEVMNLLGGRSGLYTY